MSIVLDGVDDYVFYDVAESIFSGDFTVMLWVYPQGEGWIFYAGEFANFNRSFTILRLSDGSLQVWALDTNNPRGTGAAGALPLDTWSHVAMVGNTAQGSNFTVYVNGTSYLVGTMGSEDDFNPDKLLIGTEEGGTFLAGRFAGWKVWNAQLTQPQIAAERLKKLAAVSSPWQVVPFEAGSLLDLSGNGRDFGVVGDPTAGDEPPYATPSLLLYRSAYVRHLRSR